MRARTPSTEVECGRAELAEIDRSLVLLLAARFEAVERLFRLKRELGRPLRSRKQEAVVLARAREWALETGAPPDAVVRLFKRLLAEGKRSAIARSGLAEAGSPSVTTVHLVLPARRGSTVRPSENVPARLRALETPA
jgi:chorismate mutase